MKKHVVPVALLASISAPAFAQTVMDSQSYRMMAAQSDAFEIASSQLALQRSRNPTVRRFAQEMIQAHAQTSQALNGGRPVYTASGEFIAGSLGGTLAGAGIGALIGGPVGAAVGAGVGAAAGTTAGAAAEVQSTGSITPVRIGVPLSPEKTAMLNQLASTSGAQFDRLYGQYQRMGHQEALALHANYAQAGGDPSLRQFAASVVPHIEQHMADTRRLPGGSVSRRR
ncbi:DUF305 domain-containing protein [Microvirga sp. KLBC 81]|uniref:DUF4142 domain-containing protein n=1 Tax=Microvirga sp. KLBC 81 TaxID=1862707 RepID=UPI000D50941F|nr:DUF4142 domain-containing protein [Microvirga sp. KLBC 81]PVE23073.1 DUF305 domain-containing protein [Microvirga sp. KLBC 81]